LAANLPVKNFTNIFIAFFSFLSEIFLFINLAPLTAYPILTIFTGMTICLLVFLLLRANNVSPFVSLIATMFVPYIVNSANLPGIWYLIPFTGGLILFLIALINFSYQKKTFFLLMSLFSVLVYPPLIVFVAPVLFFTILFDAEKTMVLKVKILVSVFLFFGLSVFLIFYSQKNNINLLTHFIFDSVWRLNLDGGIPTFYFWRVVPALLIPFYVIGFLKSFDRKRLALVVAIITGSLFWFFL
jgi:hypothetical protein